MLKTVAAFALLVSACTAIGTPDIALPETRVDLGQVVNGEIRQWQAQVRNEGSRPLIIESVTTSCGCTQAEVTPTLIPAGGGGVLSVTYDSGAHGPSFTGEIARQIFISSNDPDERETVVELTADVVVDE